MLGISGQNNIKEECFIDDNVLLSGLISFTSALNPIGKKLVKDFYRLTLSWNLWSEELSYCEHDIS